MIPALALAALIDVRAGDTPSTLLLVQEFLRRTEAIPYYRARHLPNVVRALCGAGDTDQASQLLVPESAVVFANDRHSVITAHAIVAEAEGKSEQALSLYNDAAHRWHEYGFVLEEGQALLGAGRCVLALGRRTEASTALQEARNLFNQLGATPLRDETDRHLGEVTALSS